MYPASLSAFNRADMDEMISFRWYVAGGGNKTPFKDDVLAELFRVSLGLPREIVKLCDLALLAAFSNKRNFVEVEDIKNVALELNLQVKK